MTSSIPKGILMTLVSTESVTADPPLANQREPLSEVDEWLSQSSHWLGFALRFDSSLTVETVKQGLVRTLTHIPALGARVDKNSSALAELVLTPDRQGVVFDYYKGSCDDADQNLPDDKVTRKVWKSAGLDAPAAGFSGAPTLNDPLLRVRFIVFEDREVSYLSIGINHGLCDGSGICDILQVWSHFCNTADADGLPEALRRPRNFGRRVTTPFRPANSPEELAERLEKDVGCCQNPFSLRTLLFSIVPRAIWCMSRQEELELRASASRLLELKNAISACLSSDEWASRFEVLCAALLLAEMATSDTAPAKSHNLHVACDLRGRAERFSKDYFGNAAFDFRQPLSSLQDLSTSKAKCLWNIENVATLTKKVHSAVRKGLADPEDVCKTKDWYEAARHLGVKNKYDIWAPVVMDALTGDGTFVNSWGMRFLDVSMGGGRDSKASAMVAYFGVLQNLIVEVPRQRETGDTTIYLALPPAHARKFREFCQENKGKVPIDIVT